MPVNAQVIVGGPAGQAILELQNRCTVLEALLAGLTRSGDNLSFNGGTIDLGSGQMIADTFKSGAAVGLSGTVLSNATATGGIITGLGA